LIKNVSIIKKNNWGCWLFRVLWNWCSW